MGLSDADEGRIEAEVARMVGELRDRPSQEKEDRIGVEIATLPAAERDFVPTVLLRFVAAERDGAELPEAAAGSPRSRSRSWVNPLRFRRAWKEAEAARGQVEGVEEPPK